MTSILSAVQLAGLPASELAFYGLKAAGYADLLAAQAESPAAYLVPEAWAIPAQVGGILDGAELRTAFENLTQGRRTKGVMMARSSSMEERPGTNSTLMRKYDPQDPRGSLQQFLSSIFGVRNTAPNMGVLATMAVGGIRVFGPGDERFGWDNVSFIADSHSPLNPDEMIFAFVHGLGTRVVEGGGEVIQVAVDRRTCKITGFVNQNIMALQQIGGSGEGVDHWGEYIQRFADSYDMKKGAVQHHPLERGLATEDHYLVWSAGRLYGADKLRFADGYRILGITPFATPKMLENLIDILVYLAECFGPVQIEGAFESHLELVPHLYQLMPVPVSESESGHLLVANPFLTSNKVIGKGSFEGPLVAMETPYDLWTSRPLETLDHQLAKAGYILWAERGQTRETVFSTPHATVRLSGQLENPSSHVATLMRILTRESPEKGYMFAMKVDQQFEKEPDEVVGPVRIYHRARVTSNGKELAVELI